MSLFKVPRVLVPAESYEKWATPPCEGDEEALINVALEAGDAPSTFRLFPVATDDEHEEEYLNSAKGYAYDALEQGTLSKLTRGCVFVRRAFSRTFRQGVLVCIDLEAVGDSVRLLKSPDPAFVRQRAAMREKLPLEFSRALCLYKDKRGKVQKLLRGEDWEELYDFAPMRSSGRITGYFLPEDISYDIVRTLQSRGSSFVVYDGENEVAAAKAHWDKLKETLSERERRNHPAHYTLVELVNLYDEGVRIQSPRYYMTDIDEAVFCDYFKRNIKCKQTGNVLYPALEASVEGCSKCEALCRAYIKANGGALKTVFDDADYGEGVLVCLKELDKEDFFDEALKGAYPVGSIKALEKGEERYYLEGVEISYD